MYRKTILSSLLLAALGGISCAASAGTIYTIKPLGTFGGSNDEDIAPGGGINSSGQVAGSAHDSGGVNRAYLASDGKLTNLNPAGATTSRATGINDSGVISATISRSDGTDRAARIQNGAMTDLGTMGGSNSYAAAINNAGTIVGSSQLLPNQGLFHAFMTEGDRLVDVGTLIGPDGYSELDAINNLGMSAGYSAAANGQEHAISYFDGKMTDLGTLGGLYAQAFGINDGGAVVGYSFTASGDQHAFLYANGSMIDLGTLGAESSYAWDVNNAGEVVGGTMTYNGFTRSAYTAFLYKGGQMLDLNTMIDPASGWHLEWANAINDKGQISARACATGGGNCQDVLLTLADTGEVTDPNAVPEPEAFSAIAAALGLAGLVRRRRNKQA